jgi:hypothetical protein
MIANYRTVGEVFGASADMIVDVAPMLHKPVFPGSSWGDASSFKTHNKGILTESGPHGTDRIFKDITFAADCDTKEISVW